MTFELRVPAAALSRALTEVTTTPDRLDLLKAAVTIYLEDGKTEAARAAVAEFKETAGEMPTPVIEAEASAASGLEMIACPGPTVRRGCPALVGSPHAPS